jgi:CBS domain-containing protein
MSGPTVSEPIVSDGDRSAAITGHDPVMKLIARTPVFVALDATLRDAARILTEESIGALLVHGAHGPAGVLSERDIVAALAEGAEPGRDRVRDYMTPDLESVPATATIAEAEECMLANEIRHLVVTKDGKTLGLISIRDVLAAVPAT